MRTNEQSVQQSCVLKGNRMSGFTSGEVVGVTDDCYIVLHKQSRTFHQVPKSIVKIEPLLDGRSIAAILQRATEAANAAGDAYLATNPSWYPCGRCHLMAKGIRTKQFKALLAAGVIDANRVYSHGAVIEIPHRFTADQSYGLARVCTMAAKEVLEKFGFDILTTWEYID